MDKGNPFKIKFGGRFRFHEEVDSRFYTRSIGGQRPFYVTKR